MACEGKSRGLLALDIEKTGCESSKDEIFAVGFAHVSFDEELFDPQTRVEFFNRRVSKHRIVLDLKKPEDMSWKELWETRGYCQKTFDEFWSTREDVLTDLQEGHGTSVKAKSRREFASFINALLAVIEAKYSSVTILSDTLTVDVPGVSALLTSFDYQPLCQSRSGAYQSGYEVDSYLMGVFNSFPNDEHPPNTRKFLSDRRCSTQLQDHRPENDALSLLDDFVTGCYIAHTL